MKKYFCIFCGDCPEDTRLEGVVESGAVARQLCAQHNILGVGDPWFYQESKLLAPPSKNVKLGYVHEVLFFKRGNTYALHKDPDRYKYYQAGCKNIPTVPSIQWGGYRNNFICATIPSTSVDRKLVEKVALSMLKTFLTQQGGGTE